MAALPMAACADRADSKALPKNIYEWRIYTLTGDGQALDDYYSATLIPACNRLGVKVGAFSLFKPAELEQRYFLFTYRDWAAYLTAKQSLWQDSAFTKAAAPFFAATAPTPVYFEFQTFLCEAFNTMPTLLRPAPERTLFEFRNYKSPNEEANLRKIKMFESGEIAIFDKVGINSVCYGNVMAGPRMPSLVYLTWHKDEPTRNAAWKQFGSAPEWDAMRGLPEYANTATDNKVVLLSPMSYSQI
jgi:hypothetical protein